MVQRWAPRTTGVNWIERPLSGTYWAETPVDAQWAAGVSWMQDGAYPVPRVGNRRRCKPVGCCSEPLPPTDCVYCAGSDGKMPHSYLVEISGYGNLDGSYILDPDHTCGACVDNLCCRGYEFDPPVAHPPANPVKYLQLALLQSSGQLILAVGFADASCTTAYLIPFHVFVDAPFDCDFAELDVPTESWPSDGSTCTVTAL